MPTAQAPPLPLLLPDAGPLITLAYAQRLDLLLRPGWPLQLVDMVLHEVTRRDLFVRADHGAHEIWHNGKRRVTVSFNMPARHTAKPS